MRDVTTALKYKEEISGVRLRQEIKVVLGGKW
jgi:hypothetical protein